MSFDGVQVLNGLSFDDEVSTLAIIGPSGGGKSTLLRILGGLQNPTSGSVRIDGVPVDYDERSLPAYRAQLGYVFQQGGLFAHMSALENIVVPLCQVHGFSKADAEERALGLLERFGLAESAGKLPMQLSGGQQQRVAIARALVNEPKVLLLDEPLGALDAKIRKQMQVELKKIQREVGITFIYVTHDQEEALSMSDTVVVMNNGEIQQIGTPTDIYNEPENRFVAGFIGESNIIEGVMIRDYLVEFDGFRFECVDKGFEENEEIEVVLRPEDLDIVDKEQAQINGIVRNITFKGVHYEILVETPLRTYMVHTTDYAEVGREVGLKFGPEDIHVMCKMGIY